MDAYLTQGRIGGGLKIRHFSGRHFLTILIQLNHYDTAFSNFINIVTMLDINVKRCHNLKMIKIHSKITCLCRNKKQKQFYFQDKENLFGSKSHSFIYTPCELYFLANVLKNLLHQNLSPGHQSCSIL